MKNTGIERKGYFLIKVGENFNIKSLLSIKEMIEQGFEVGKSNFAFDMRVCSHMDSSGIGLVANLNKKCMDKKGKIFFIAPTAEILELMEISSLDSFVTVCKSEEEVPDLLN